MTLNPCQINGKIKQTVKVILNQVALLVLL